MKVVHSSSSEAGMGALEPADTEETLLVAALEVPSVVTRL